ncbi:MAG: hypothetical protein GYB36_09100 [Alphaproteobacteria bacterium]|nr:hypothetical protein [Alphaproteobacteria bacterium]
MRALGPVIVILSCLVLSGCLRSGARELNAAQLRTYDDHALLFIGVRQIGEVEGWGRHELRIQAYNPQTQSTRGDCWRFDRLVVEGGTMDEDVQYRVFRMPAGTYAFPIDDVGEAPWGEPDSANRTEAWATNLDDTHAYFDLRPGSVAYLGDISMRLVDAGERDLWSQYQRYPVFQSEWSLDLVAASQAAASRGVPALEPVEVHLRYGRIMLGFLCTP